MDPSSLSKGTERSVGSFSFMGWTGECCTKVVHLGGETLVTLIQGWVHRCTSTPKTRRTLREIWAKSLQTHRLIVPEMMGFDIIFCCQSITVEYHTDIAHSILEFGAVWYWVYINIS